MSFTQQLLVCLSHSHREINMMYMGEKVNYYSGFSLDTENCTGLQTAISTVEVR